MDKDNQAIYEQGNKMGGFKSLYEILEVVYTKSNKTVYKIKGKEGSDKLIIQQIKYSDFKGFTNSLSSLIKF